MKLALGLSNMLCIRRDKLKKINIPEGFRWTPSFEIYESGRTYSTNFDIASLKPAGTTKWVAKTGSDSAGDGSQENPYATLSKAYTMGADIIKIKAGIYNRADGFTANFAPTRSIALISEDGPGKAVITRRETGLSWVQQASPNDNVYLTTRSSVRTVLDLTYCRSGEFLKDGVTGLPKQMTQQTSVANCQANPNSWYQAGSNLYVRTFDGRAPDENIAVLLIENIMAITAVNTTFYMEGIEMWGDSGARMILGADNTSIFAWKDSASRFCGASTQNGLIISSVSYCYSMNCEISDVIGAADGFNYHSDNSVTTTRVKALELNCVSKRCGVSGQTNNNGTTSHDNCDIIRLNGNYQYSYGPLTADTLGAYSLNMGCTCGNSYVGGVSGQNSAFQVGTAGAIDGVNSKMWLKNCTAVGSNYSRYQSTGGDLYDLGGFIDNTTLHDYGTITQIS